MSLAVSAFLLPTHVLTCPGFPVLPIMFRKEHVIRKEAPLQRNSCLAFIIKRMCTVCYQVFFVWESNPSLHAHKYLCPFSLFEQYFSLVHLSKVLIFFVNVKEPVQLNLNCQWNLFLSSRVSLAVALGFLHAQQMEDQLVEKTPLDPSTKDIESRCQGKKLDTFYYLHFFSFDGLRLDSCGT